MPFVEGLSLRDRLASGGSLPIANAISILRDVARALAYAHEHGVMLLRREGLDERIFTSSGQGGAQ